MTIITYALGFEVAFVATCQVYRVFLILTFAPLLSRALRLGPPAAGPKDGSI